MYNITDAVLSETLKDLMKDGIVDCKSYDEIPPRVEYSLTQKGKSVVPILQSICQWSDIFTKKKGKMKWYNVRSVTIEDKEKRKCLHKQKKRNLQRASKNYFYL